MAGETTGYQCVTCKHSRRWEYLKHTHFRISTSVLWEECKRLIWLPHFVKNHLLFYFLCGVTEAIIVVVKNGSSKNVNTVVFLCITFQQRPLQIIPDPCMQKKKQTSEMLLFIQKQLQIFLVNISLCFDGGSLLNSSTLSVIKYYDACVCENLI